MRTRVEPCGRYYMVQFGPSVARSCRKSDEGCMLSQENDCFQTSESLRDGIGGFGESVHTIPEGVPV